MAIKSSRGVTSGKGTPQNREGQNGDITVRSTPLGKKLYVKDSNKWGSINLDIDAVDLQKKIDLLLYEVRRLKNKTRNKPSLDAAILRKPGSADIQLKNSSGALNIRNAADSADVQLGVGYGGTGLSTFGAADKILKTSDATTLDASSTLPNAVQDNITRLGSIASGTVPVARVSGLATSATTDTTNADNITSGTLAAGRVATLNQDTTGTAAKATAINTSSNGFVKTGSGNGTVSISSEVDLTSDVTGVLPVANTAAKCTVAAADQTSAALRTLAGTTELTSLDMANDNIFISDASDGSNVHRSTAKVLTSAMSGDGLSSTSGVMKIDVDDATVELSASDGSGVLRAKTAAIEDAGTGLATADQIHTFVTSQGYGTGTVTISNELTNTVVTSTGSGGVIDREQYHFMDDNNYMFIYDAQNYFKIGRPGSNGETTISTVDYSTGTAGNLTLDIDGDIELNADGGNIVFKDNTASLATINSDGLTINNISSGDGSGENFLVEESGVVKKRTAAQTLNDIGAMPDSGDITISGTLSITDTGSPPLKVAYDANHFATFDMDTNGVLEIECTDGGSAESKLQLKNGGTTSDQYLVWGNSSETARITSNGAQNLVLNTNEGTNSGYIELQDAANGDISIIPNGTGDIILGSSSGSIQFATTTFLDGNGNAMFGTAVASSAVNNVELGNAATGNAATLKATGTDTNVPLTVSTKGTGAVTIDSGGDIALDAASGNFTAKKGGVEFSAANSAYAGMVLGYTYIQPSSTVLSFEIQNALTVEDDGHKVTFKTPPSEKVEIEVTAMINCSSSDTRISVGLSSANATDGYSSVAGQFEYDSSGIFFTDDEVDDHVKTFKFVVEAANLAAVGSDNTFWIGFSTSNSTKTAYLTYGYRSSHGIANHPFTIKATALPAAIYDGT